MAQPPSPRRTPDAEGGDHAPTVWRVGDVVLELYEVVAVLGAGGMGVVHRVHHRLWGIDLAVKSPLPALVGDERGRAAFENEAETWIGLGLHPHVCACHYVRRLGGVPRVFAEYMEGGSLADRIRDHSLYRGDEDEVLARMLDIAVQFARGLAHAHARSVVHQDVKPANVLLDGAGQVKIADFGLARAGTATAARGDVAATQRPSDPCVSFAGVTPAYQSPEQAGAALAARTGAGAPALTAATDTWSFAVSLMELFAGEVVSPDGQAAPQVLKRLASRGARHPSIPRLSHALASLLSGCLRRDPRARPALADVAAALADFHGAHTGAAYPPEPRAADLLAGEQSNRALSLLDLGRTADAERSWEAALAQDPQHAQATYNQGLYLWRDARITDDELVRRLADVRGPHREAWLDDLLMGLAHVERGAVTAARPLLEGAARQTSDPEATSALDAARAATDAARCVRSVTTTVLGEKASTVMPGHGLTVIRGDNAVALAANGELAMIAVGEEAGIWDPRAGDRVRALEGVKPSASAQCVALSPDGAYALAGFDTKVKLWRLAGGGGGREFSAHSSAILALAITRGGQFALTAGCDRTAKLWDLQRERHLRTLSGGDVLTCVRFVAGDRRALTSGFDGTVRLWDLHDGRCAHVIEAHQDRVWSLAVSDDGRIAVTGSQDTTAAVWNVPDGRRICTLAGAGHCVTAVALTGDGQVALTGDDGGAIRVWDAVKGRCLLTLNGPNLHVASLALTADGRTAVACGGDRATRALIWQTWELRHDARRASPWAYTRPRATREAALARDRLNESLAHAQRLIDAGEARAAADHLRELRRTPGYAHHPDVLLHWQRVTRMGRRTTLDAVRTRDMAECHSAPIRSVAMSADARTGLSAGDDRSTVLWSLDRGVPRGSFRARRPLPPGSWHPVAFNVVALTPDGRLGLIGANDNALEVWDLAADPRCRHRLGGHAGAITALAVTADGRLALSAGSDRNARLWDLQAGRCIHVLKGEHAPVALSSDGHWALTTPAGDRVAEIVRRARRAGGRHVVEPGIVRLWDLDGPTCVRVLDHAAFSRGGGLTFSPEEARTVTAAALARDGARAATAMNAQILLWDRESTEPRVALKGHNYQVRSLALSADGRVAVSGDGGGIVHMWDLVSGQRLWTPEGQTSGVEGIAITPDARHVLSSGGTGLRLWELEWDFEFPEPADWHEGARPVLESFLRSCRPWAEPLKGGRPLRAGTPLWRDEDLARLMSDLQDAGYGWLARQGVRSRLSAP